MRSVVFASRVFVGTVSDENSFELWTSADAANWSRTYWLTNAGFRTAYAGPDGFHVWGLTDDVVSVDLTYEISAHLTSSNGYDWRSIIIMPEDNGLAGPPFRPNIAFADGTYVAATSGTWGGEGLYTSMDGVNWIERLSTDQRPAAVAFGQDSFIAVGEGGAILQSAPVGPSLALTLGESGVSNVLNLLGLSGRTYQIEKSADLRSWQKLVDLISTNDAMRFQLDVDKSNSFQFYRAVLLPSGP
jgi:hypothetical protein